MANTINVEIRKHLRLNSTDYTDDDIKNKIERTLDYLNAKTGEEYVIADLDNATTGSLTYDDLIVYMSLWRIFTEIYKLSILKSDPNERSSHISSIWRTMFFEMFASCYPALVEMRAGGVIGFTTVAAAETDVGYVDSRFTETESHQFDRTVF